MDRIRMFDEKYLKNCISNWEIQKLMMSLLAILACMMSCIPFETLEDEGFVIFFVDLFFLGCINIYLLPYLTVNENGKLISLATKLKYTPVDIDMIVKNRKIKMWKYIAVTVTIITVIQIIKGLILRSGIFLVMLLLPLSVFIIMTASGTYGIHCFSKKFRE